MPCPDPCGAWVQGGYSTNLNPCRYFVGVTGANHDIYGPVLPLSTRQASSHHLQALWLWADLVLYSLFQGSPLWGIAGIGPALSTKFKRTPQTCRTRPPLPAA